MKMSSCDKHKHTTLTLSAKVKTIRKLHKGGKLINLAKEYGVGRDTIYDIMKNKRLCGNLPQCKTDNSQRVAKAGDIYKLQITAWRWDAHTSAIQPALIAETQVITG
jgi:hypothetical protein